MSILNDSLPIVEQGTLNIKLKINKVYIYKLDISYIYLHIHNIFIDDLDINLQHDLYLVYSQILVRTICESILIIGIEKDRCEYILTETVLTLFKNVLDNEYIDYDYIDDVYEDEEFFELLHFIIKNIVKDITVKVGDDICDNLVDGIDDYYSNLVITNIISDNKLKIIEVE